MARSDLHQKHIERLGNPPFVEFGKPLLQISKGDPLAANDKWADLMVGTMAWLCILAVEQNRTMFRAGTVSEWRQEARELEGYIQKLNSFQSGTEEMLATIQQRENWSDEKAAPHWEGIKSNARIYWLESAELAARFLLRVAEKANRKGRQGRPTGSFTLDIVLNEQDRVLIEAAVQRSGKDSDLDRETLNVSLLEVVREQTKRGDIRDYHTTANEPIQTSISTHMKRLNRRLDSLEQASLEGKV